MWLTLWLKSRQLLIFTFSTIQIHTWQPEWTRTVEWFVTWKAWRWEGISSPCWRGRCWLRSLRAHGPHCARLLAERRQHHNFCFRLPTAAVLSAERLAPNGGGGRGTSAENFRRRSLPAASGCFSLRFPQGRKERLDPQRARVPGALTRRRSELQHGETSTDSIPRNAPTISSGDVRIARRESATQRLRTESYWIRISREKKL